MAQREKNPDAHISSLPLENLTSKDFKADPIAIDAPNATDFVSMEDDTQPDDDILTNPADKYRKYEEMAARGMFGTGNRRN